MLPCTCSECPVSALGEGRYQVRLTFGNCETCGQLTPHRHFARRSKSCCDIPAGSRSGCISTECPQDQHRTSICERPGGNSGSSVSLDMPRQVSEFAAGSSPTFPPLSQYLKYIRHRDRRPLGMQKLSRTRILEESRKRGKATQFYRRMFMAARRKISNARSNSAALSN